MVMTIKTRLLMTAAERAVGRYLRAPDHPVDPEFAAFETAGDVEVGEANLGGENPKEDAPVEENQQETPVDGEPDPDAGEDGEKEPKTPRDPKESQINRLKREKAELARQLRQVQSTPAPELAARLENLEKLLQGGNSGGNPPGGNAAPDPTDTDKYPLGHLDDRYIEDKLEWLADQKASQKAESVLQRQQERDNQLAAEQQQRELLTKVDNLATKGTELFDDYQESVVEAGMRGDWDLSQETFEAAHDAENGAQILYDLAQNKAEAARVARLSPYQQLKYVMDRDTEISKAKSGRKIPKAGDPPTHTARGANSRTQISGATDNLDDFEKAWEQDAKRGR
jgi:hypothetical protein